MPRSRKVDKPIPVSDHPASPISTSSDVQDADWAWDFFIAYPSADRNVALALYDAISRSSRVFIDLKALDPGDRWDQRLHEEQRRSRITIVLITPNTDTAYYQREEIAAAIDLSRKSVHRIVPVYAGCEKTACIVPYGLQTLHSLTVIDRRSMSKAATQLLKLLGRLIAVESEAPLEPPEYREWWLEQEQTSGMILSKEAFEFELMDMLIRRIIPGQIALHQSLVDTVTDVRSILGLLSPGYSFIVLPLTLPNYNSLRLAELAHRLKSATRIILLSGTGASREALETLFDSFVRKSVDIELFRRALGTSPRRMLSKTSLEFGIERILFEAGCFERENLRHPKPPLTLAEYRQSEK